VKTYIVDLLEYMLCSLHSLTFQRICKSLLMTVRHFKFLESFYDIFEFTSKLKQQEKQEKLKKQKKGNRVTITEKRVTI